MKIYLAFFAFLFSYGIINAQVVINEASSTNSATIIDEDHDSPDWIELYNISNNDINLKSWRIGDGKKFEKAWELPDVTIKSKDRLLVYASDKNLHNSGKFIMEAGGIGIFPHALYDSYRFDYMELEGDFTVSARIHSLSNVDIFGSAGLIIREDLTNENRFFGILSQKDTRHDLEYMTREETGQYPVRKYSKTELMYPDLVLEVSRKGDSLIAGIYDYEGYCFETYSIETDYPDKVYVGFALSSTRQNMIGKATFSAFKINGEPADFNILTGQDFDLDLPGKSYISDELHTDFKLSRKGETLTLWNDQEQIIDQFTFPKMYVDMSYGRFPDGSDNLTFFLPPTPKKENDNPKNGLLEQTKFSIEPGFYTNPVDLIIIHSNMNAKIHYTTNGDEPTEDSPIYNGETIHLEKSTVIKARAFEDGYIPSEIETASYLFDVPNVGLPTISVSSDSVYFYDETTGLFTRPHDKPEYPGTIEYFTPDGNRAITNRMGIQPNGQTATLKNQISLRFKSKSKYGESSLEYPFFGLYGLKEYDHIIIRNSGQNWYTSFLNDGFIAVLGNYIDNIFGTLYQPVMVYINSEFWGMYNLRERFHDDYLSSKFKVSKASLSIIESPLTAKQGAVRSYFDLVDAVPNISDDEVYNYINELIDIDNFIDYNAVSFWANNTDWPMSNLKFWRSNELDNKWRWILKDFDISLQQNQHSAYDYDYLPILMDSIDADPYFYHFGVILKNALRNNQFRVKYLNRNCDLLNSTLKNDFVRPLFDSLVHNIIEAIPYHKERWTESLPYYLEHYDAMREFFEQRPQYYRESLRNYFDLSGISKITLNSNYDESCTYNVNSLKNLQDGWEGYYLNDIPINISAVPKSGYTFQHWAIGDSIYTDLNISIILSDSTEILAIFSSNDDEDEEVSIGIVVNEIMYKAAKDEDTDDWIELLNAGDEAIDISGWDLKDDDDKHSFIIPDGTILESGEYLVLVVSEELFTQFHSDVDNYIGEVGYGFGKSDGVRIFDKNGNLMDSVTYTSTAPWYPETNGEGPSLELIDPTLDNSLAASWRPSSVKGGTPGRPNTTVSVQNTILDNYIKVYPNPASESTYINFSLNYDSKVNVRICDILGNTIKNIFEGYYQAGNYTSYWNGMNNQGDKMSSGLYYVIISTDRGIIRDKIVLE